MQNIELVQTQDLIEEISKRFDSCIFYGVRKGKSDKDQDRFWWHYIGCKATNLGLCEMMKTRLNESLEEPIETEDF